MDTKLNLEDIQIKFIKYDETKNIVLLNLIVLEALEIRGYVVRYTTTKNSPRCPIWIASPPAMRSPHAKTYFWITKVLNPNLWQQLQQKMIDLAVQKTNLN